MDHRFDSTLAWIDDQRERMVKLVERWSNINSGSFNLTGLARMAQVLDEAFAVLGGQRRFVDLAPAETIDSNGLKVTTPLGQAIHITNRPDAPLRVFLGIHMDTVYPAHHPFQTTQPTDPNTFRGPGVADAKGGLAVMLIALEALERNGLAQRLGWEVLINPDEEIGSPGSSQLLADCAKRNHLGLVFEPTLPDGTMVGDRKGSGNFTVVVHGRSAHAGREFPRGRNAIAALAGVITELDALNRDAIGKQNERVTVNVGRVDGGGPVNVVPDLAICRFNLRISRSHDAAAIRSRIDQIIESVNYLDGISVDLHGGITSPPKPMDEKTARLFHQVAACGSELGIPINWQPSGGVCDGNKLAAAGLPTVDTLGPRGGDLHSPNEYLLLDSLTERAKLSALLLMKLASGEWDGSTDDRVMS